MSSLCVFRLLLKGSVVYRSGGVSALPESSHQTALALTALGFRRARGFESSQKSATLLSGTEVGYMYVCTVHTYTSTEYT